MKRLLITPESIQELDLTVEEISQREKDEQNTILELQKKEQEKQDAETKKASGKQKLLDLGLSEEEVKALIGV